MPFLQVPIGAARTAVLTINTARKYDGLLNALRQVTTRLSSKIKECNFGHACICSESIGPSSFQITLTIFCSKYHA
jgi:hypothetical protein